MEKPGGREGGEENVRAFNEWVAERERAGDWADYLHRGQLNRSEVARECSFALSCFRSNPALRRSLETVEARLRSSGILSVPSAPECCDLNGVNSSGPGDLRISRAKYRAEQRVKVLEEQNAALQAEVKALQGRLKHFAHLEHHLCKTGRLLHR